MMRLQPVMDVAHLTPYRKGSEAPLWWGFVGIIAIESAVFATLIVSYFYLRFNSTVWPPAGIEAPALLLPTINTLILLASSVAMVHADQAVNRGDNRGIARGLLIASLLALTFLVLKVVEYHDVPHPWDESAYGSIVWTIIGFHTAHVTVLLLKTAVVGILAARGYFNKERQLGVKVNGLYWHFVVIIWVPLYVVLYWVPRT